MALTQPEGGWVKVATILFFRQSISLTVSCCKKKTKSPSKKRVRSKLGSDPPGCVREDIWFPGSARITLSLNAM